MLRVLFHRKPRRIITVDGITHITTGAITTDITTTGTIIGIGLGSPGHGCITAIGKRWLIVRCRGLRSPLFEIALVLVRLAQILGPHR